MQSDPLVSWNILSLPSPIAYLVSSTLSWLFSMMAFFTRSRLGFIASSTAAFPKACAATACFASGLEAVLAVAAAGFLSGF